MIDRSAAEVLPLTDTAQLTLRHTTKNRKHDLFAVVLSWVVITFVSALSILQQAPPNIVSSSASSNLFSAGRAMQHVTAIAKQPHPIGSVEHAIVRDYIVNELKAAGLTPHIQRTNGVSKREPNIENILATVKGTTAGRSLLLVAHYDSAPESSGASDDGAGVATLLETLRALRTVPPLRNDVMFLFTDGEEKGLLGAKAFVNEHPDAANVGLVLNFEARGTNGPSVMFETSEGNGWMIREFAQAVSFPRANSLSYEVYRLLPNNTDLTVFKNAGVPGLNFAYIDGANRYHTRLDDVDHLDQRSLQHHGSYALELTRHFGNIDLNRGRESDQIYFDLFGRVLLHYPVFWAIPLALFVSCLFLGLTVVGLKNGSLRLEGIAAGALALLSALLVSALATTLLWELAQLLPGQGNERIEAAQSRLYLTSFVLLAIALTSAINVVISKKSSIESLTIGGLLLWTIFALAMSLFLPGASFLFAWPLCFSLLGAGLMIFSKYRTQQKLPVTLWIALSLCPLPGILIFVPIAHQVFLAFTLNSSFVIIAMVVILLGLLVPHLQFLIRRLRWLVPEVAGASSVALFVVALFS